LALRRPIATALVTLVATFAAERVGADHMPLVYPDGAIVYGDWGLYRPGAIVPFVEGPYVVTAPRAGTGYYFPSNRADPAAYRSPPPRPSIPADPWYRAWGAQSDPAPATIPNEGPAVIYAPNFEGHPHHGKKP
jgi:hypothetical protein